jgi:hypothetical protein
MSVGFSILAALLRRLKVRDPSRPASMESQLQPKWVTPEDKENIDVIKSRFEGRTAIYLEKGVLVVTVFDICAGPYNKSIYAKVREEPTRGLERPLIQLPNWDGKRPLQWEIGSGLYTSVSTEIWSVGYGLWTLFFDEPLVVAFCSLAASWDDSLDSFARYHEACEFVYKHEFIRRPRRRVFKD